MLLAARLPFSVEAQLQGNCNPPADKEWIVRAAGSTTCQDRDIHVRNLTLDDGATLPLKNVRLIVQTTFDATPTTSHRIYVFGAASKLTLLDSTMESANPSHHYKVTVRTP